MNVIGGIIVPIVTPLSDDQQVDARALAGLCERQIRAGSNALFALGTTGEFYALSLRQRRQVVETILETVAGRIPVIVGISGESTSAALVNFLACPRDGVAGYVASTPYFFSYTQDELADHFRRLANEIGQPIILYNYPARYRHRIDISTVAALASEGLVSSIKDTAGDFEYMKELLALKRSYPKLGVFESALQNLSKAAPLGIDGSVQALANLFPGEFCRVWAAILRREWDAVSREAERLWSFHNAMEKVAPFVVALKGCMAARAWCGTTPGAPTRAVSQQQLRALEQLLSRFDASAKG